MIVECFVVRFVGILVGLNIGVNKDSDDKSVDFVVVIDIVGVLVDFLMVNVLLLNIEKLWDL